MLEAIFNEPQEVIKEAIDNNVHITIIRLHPLMAYGREVIECLLQPFDYILFDYDARHDSQVSKLQIYQINYKLHEAVEHFVKQGYHNPIIILTYSNSPITDIAEQYIGSIIDYRIDLNILDILNDFNQIYELSNDKYTAICEHKMMINRNDLLRTLSDIEQVFIDMSRQPENLEKSVYAGLIKENVHYYTLTTEKLIEQIQQFRFNHDYWNIVTLLSVTNGHVHPSTQPIYYAQSTNDYGYDVGSLIKNSDPIVDLYGLAYQHMVCIKDKTKTELEKAKAAQDLKEIIDYLTEKQHITENIPTSDLVIGYSPQDVSRHINAKIEKTNVRTSFHRTFDQWLQTYDNEYLAESHKQKDDHIKGNHTPSQTNIIGQTDVYTQLDNGVQSALEQLFIKPRIGYTALLSGKPGIGKTAISETLATTYQLPYLRIDCGELSGNDLNDTAKWALTGPPRGYRGYEDGSRFTNFLTEHNGKPALILFDEIEKVHPQVQDMLLRLLSTGQMVTPKDVEIDATKMVVLMTTNAMTRPTVGFSKDNQIQFADGVFKPEFLNRFDDIVQLNDLTDNDLREIAKDTFDKYAQVNNGRYKEPSQRWKTKKLAEIIQMSNNGRDAFRYAEKEIRRFYMTHRLKPSDNTSTKSE